MAQSGEDAIRDVCKMADREDLADVFIGQGISDSEATRRLMAMRRAGDALVKDAEKRARAEAKQTTA